MTDLLQLLAIFYKKVAPAFQYKHYYYLHTLYKAGLCNVYKLFIKDQKRNTGKYKVLPLDQGLIANTNNLSPITS